MVCQEIFLRKSLLQNFTQGLWRHLVFLQCFDRFWMLHLNVLVLVAIFTQGGEDCEDIWYGERKPRDDKGLRVHHHHQRVLQPDDGGLHRLRWNIWEKNYFQVFGPEKGVGARSAVGLATLPHNCPVEVECVFQIKKDVSFNKYCWIWPGKFKVIHCTIWQILLSINFYLFLWLCFLTSSQASLIC